MTPAFDAKDAARGTVRAIMGVALGLMAALLAITLVSLLLSQASIGANPLVGRAPGGITLDRLAYEAAILGSYAAGCATAAFVAARIARRAYVGWIATGILCALCLGTVLAFSGFDLWRTVSLIAIAAGLGYFVPRFLGGRA
jgi:hypothetical protein